MTEYLQLPGIDLRGELGHGAYSIVYRAIMGTTPCAVKIPRTKGRWTPWVYREAVALARVNHPGLPAVLEVGEQQGLPYLVMELVEGETLAERLRRGPLDRSASLQLATHLVSALAAVHGAGLVHRDVKPQNIIVEQSGRVRLVDFGFATPMERSEMSAGAGTPKYAAPEQFRTPSRIDGRSDLYAVGRVLFECATCAQPVGDPDPQTLAAVLGDDAARMVCGLVAHEPDARYPDARAVLVDLTRIANGRPSLGPGAFEATRHHAPLVGRGGEVERAARRMASLDTGRGACVLVRGARGSGKSAFLAASCDRIRSRGGRLIEVTCREDAAPLSALRDLFDGLLDAIVRAAPAEKAAAESALRVAATHLEPLAVVIAPKLGPLLRAKPADAPSPEAFLEGGAELLVRLSKAMGPFVAVFDDVQWMDRVSRSILARVGDRMDEAPLGLILASRLDGATDDALAVLADHASTIDLAALTDMDTEELIARHLHSAAAPPEVTRHVAALADGTPLGVLEVLGAFLDCGALRPRAGAWTFDPARVEHVRLPEGALALLGRRLYELPEATRRVLTVAAILGAVFEDELLAQALALAPADVGFALAATRRAGILELASTGRHRFLHDSLREVLLRDAAVAERRRWHQRIAEILDDGGADVDRLHRAAHHYESGEVEQSPARAFKVARGAATSALGRFDNETAVRLLEFARKAGALGRIDLDPDFHRSIGEAHLRLGALDESLRAFDAGLTCARDDVTRASLLGRISWVRHSRGEVAPAWDALERAFTAIHARMPSETVTTVAHAAGQLARHGLRKVVSRQSRQSEVERELLCELHFQNARLGSENEKPLRLLQSTLEMLEIGESLGPSRSLARAAAAYGFVATALSRGRTGSASLERASEMSRELGDPVVLAFCVQQQAMAAAYSGDFAAALELFRKCVDDYGSWLEFNEYCIDAWSAEYIETLRGRSGRALPTLWRALERLRRSPPNSGFQYSTLLFRVRAALTALGREPDAWLVEQLQRVEANDGPSEAFQRKLAWGPRIRALVEAGNVGPKFEALVRAFEAEGHKPKTVFPVVAEYYLSVVYGRIHQCFAARHPRPDVRLLISATRDLQTFAVVPLFKAHALYAEGCIAFFEGDRAAAQRAWSKAEALATEQTCPWVLYGVARGRAHMLREMGNADGAREQARFAQMLANEHGAVHRERFVREEFDLPSAVHGERSGRSSFASRSSRRARRQLAALLDVLRLPRSSLDPVEQAAKILEELLRHLDADRGLLTFQPRAIGESLRAGRSRAAGPWSDPEGWRDALVRAVQAKGEPWPTDGDPAWTHQAPEADPDRVIAIPLFLRDATVGTVFLERAAGAPPFASDDRLLVDVLSHQIPVALELARLLGEQERVQASLQLAQRLQSMGQLAGGLAHDFNNMLNAIQGSASLLRDEVAGDLLDDVDIILDATQRAAKLTRQLLSFSHQEAGPLEPCDPNALVRGLEPMLRRVLGHHVSVAATIDPDVSAILTDPSSFEQALVNLVLNARDAMPETGGKVTISVSNVVLGEDAARRGAPPIGDAVAIAVSDTGSGMTPEVLAHIFEPFFTTKDSRGTGLGLATLYAFVKNCGGHIEVASEIGRGTTFTLFFRRAPGAPKRRSLRPDLSAGPDSSTILLVDDDDSLRKSTRRLLEHHGYQVLDASTADEAYDIVQRYRKEIGLLIVDVIMPHTSGPDLARSIGAMDMAAKVLFVSGLVPAGHDQRDDLGGQPLLEKPFSPNELLARIAALMPVKFVQGQA